MTGTATQRLDDITDTAWYIVGALTLVVLADRILRTVEMLANKAGVATNTTPVEVAYVLIMTIVGISSITLALSDEWCRSIVSALSVGLGFALRDVAVEALLGVQMSATLSDNKTFTIVNQDMHDDKPTQASKKFTMAGRSLLSCTLKVQPAQGNAYAMVVPWSWLHKQLRVTTTGP